MKCWKKKLGPKNTIQFTIFSVIYGLSWSYLYISSNSQSQNITHSGMNEILNKTTLLLETKLVFNYYKLYRTKISKIVGVSRENCW